MLKCYCWWWCNTRINPSTKRRGGVITPASLFHSYQRVFVALKMFSEHIDEISVMRLPGNFYFECTIHHVCFTNRVNFGYFREALKPHIEPASQSASLILFNDDISLLLMTMVMVSKLRWVIPSFNCLTKKQVAANGEAVKIWFYEYF